MSLYILGRIHSVPSKSESLVNTLRNAMEHLGIRVELSSFEDDEKSELITEGYPWPPGVDFRLSDDSNSVDATKLWIESMISSRRSIANIIHCDPSNLTLDVVESMSLPEAYFVAASQTRLGQAIDLVVNHLGTTGGLIALMEGSIETICFCTNEECLDNIFRTLLLSWDCIPNKAYIWPSFVRGKRGHP